MGKGRFVHLLLKILPWFLLVLNSSVVLLAIDGIRLSLLNEYIETPPALKTQQVIASIELYFCGLLLVCGIAGVIGSVGMLIRRRWGLNLIRVVLVVYVIYELVIIAVMIEGAILDFKYGDSGFYYRSPCLFDHIWPITICGIIIGATVSLIYLLYTPSARRQFLGK